MHLFLVCDECYVSGKCFLIELNFKRIKKYFSILFKPCSELIKEIDVQRK